MAGLNSLGSVFFCASVIWSTLAFRFFNCSGVTVLVDGVPAAAGAGGFVAGPASCFLSASISASCAAVFFDLCAQSFPAFASTADRSQPVDLSPGLGRPSRPGKGQKTTLKFFSVSYFFSCSDATHRACAPIQNGITRQNSASRSRPTYTRGEATAGGARPGGRFSMAVLKRKNSKCGIVSTKSPAGPSGHRKPLIQRARARTAVAAQWWLALSASL